LLIKKNNTTKQIMIYYVEKKESLLALMSYGAQRCRRCRYKARQNIIVQNNNNK